MKKLFPLLMALLLSAVLITGCGPAYIAVGTRPEPPVYARPLPPGPNYLWIEGEWVWSSGAYVYRRGYWAPPRSHYHHYIPGHWQQRSHGWVWISGHWR